MVEINGRVETAEITGKKAMADGNITSIGPSVEMSGAAGGRGVKIPCAEETIAMRNVPRRARTYFIFAVLSSATLAGGSSSPAAEPQKAAESAAKKYTATALLELQPSLRRFPSAAAERDESAEFKNLRATQMQLVKSSFVIIAALRDPKVYEQPSIKREEDRHHAATWLAEHIQVKCPDHLAGIITVSLTSGDPKEAAVLVNAVVNTYMNEVVNVDRQVRRERLTELQQISAEKENEVRAKREQLKRELESIGAGDDETMKARAQMAVSMYAEFQREFQRMRSEHRALLGKLQVAKRVLADLPKAEVPEIEVAVLLNCNPRYRDLQRRLVHLELRRLHSGDVPAGNEATPHVRPDPDGFRLDQEATRDLGATVSRHGPRRQAPRIGRGDPPLERPGGYLHRAVN